MAATSRSRARAVRPRKRFRENRRRRTRSRRSRPSARAASPPRTAPTAPRSTTPATGCPRSRSSDARDAAEGEAAALRPQQVFRENQPDDDEVAEIEDERARRLAPENRPDDAEVDNTGENMPEFIKERPGRLSRVTRGPCGGCRRDPGQALACRP